jgi:hypothetical protein
VLRSTRSEDRYPRVVHEDVDLADHALHLGDVAEIGSDEARLTAGGSGLRDRFGPARSVTP